MFSSKKQSYDVTLSGRSEAPLTPANKTKQSIRHRRTMVLITRSTLTFAAVKLLRVRKVFARGLVQVPPCVMARYYSFFCARCPFGVLEKSGASSTHQLTSSNIELYNSTGIIYFSYKEFNPALTPWAAQETTPSPATNTPT